MIAPDKPAYHRSECLTCEFWREGSYLQLPRCSSLMHGCGCKYAKPGDAIFVDPKQFDEIHTQSGVTEQQAAAFYAKGASPLAAQVGGQHYKDMAIQPVEFVHANGIGYFEGCAIKYLARWRKKNGVEDLKKAIHFIELLIELESRKKP